MILFFVTQKPIEKQLCNFSAVLGVSIIHLKSAMLMQSLFPKNNSCLPGN